MQRRCRRSVDRECETCGIECATSCWTSFGGGASLCAPPPQVKRVFGASFRTEGLPLLGAHAGDAVVVVAELVLPIFAVVVVTLFLGPRLDLVVGFIGLIAELLELLDNLVLDLDRLFFEALDLGDLSVDAGPRLGARALL